MATIQTITCDRCSADITEGHGRQWTLNLYSQVTKMAADVPPRVDQGEMVPLMHFCDENCVALWATKAAATKATRQAAYVTELAAKAAAPAGDAPLQSPAAPAPLSTAG